jgi:hypothetical protein
MAGTRVFRRWRVALQTAALVVALVVLKAALVALDLEFINLSPLYTSIVAGGIFVIGLIVAGTLADYKEAEKVPAEMAAALEAILEDGRSIKETNPDLDLERLQKTLVRVVDTFREDLARGSSSCLEAINELSESFEELERLGAPPNYIVRLRQEQGVIRKSVLRVYHVQRTDFLPSAYILIQTIVLLIIAGLEVTRFPVIYEGLVVLVVISYFFLYLLRLLRIMDKPFRVTERTMDDVSLFLLREFARRAAPRPHAEEPTSKI